MQEIAVNAAFLSNKAGEVCISFSDPAYVHADTIVLDPETRGVFAVLYQSSHYLGSVSKDMAEVFSQNDHVLLSSLSAEGTVFELIAPLMASKSNGVIHQ